MKKIVFSIIIVAAFFAFTAQETLACDCIILTSDNLSELVERAYRDSKAVFSGRVIQVNGNPNGGFVKVKFKVEKSWKNVSQREIIITTGEGAGDCGYSFKEGERYLVYASDGFFDKLENLEASICLRTALFKSNKDVIALNKIKKPKKF